MQNRLNNFILLSAKLRVRGFSFVISTLDAAPHFLETGQSQ